MRHKYIIPGRMVKGPIKYAPSPYHIGITYLGGVSDKISNWLQLLLQDFKGNNTLGLPLSKASLLWGYSKQMKKINSSVELRGISGVVWLFYLLYDNFDICLIDR